MTVRALLVTLAVLVGASGCAAETVTATDRPDERASDAAARTPSPPASGASQAAVISQPSAPTRPSKADRRLAEAFLAFALEPSHARARPIGFAEWVRLGLGPDLHTGLASEHLGDGGSWQVEKQVFAGGTGPFNALSVIRDHARKSGTPTLPRAAAAFAVTVGEHSHCAAPPVPAPQGLADHHRVSLQPAERTTKSCLDWFSVDLFIDELGQVDAVTLDLWEP